MMACPAARAAHFRLGRQGLLHPFTSPEAVVDRLVAVQCQMPSACRQALAVRCAGFGRDTWDEALYERRSIVRTWANRGTVHLLPTGTRDKLLASLWRTDGQPAGAWWTALPLKADRRETIVAAMLAALAAGPLDRDSFRQAALDHLAGDEAKALAEWWPPLLQYAARTGRICFGPQHGSQSTFVRMEDWVGPRTVENPESARPWMVAQFLRSYGPATVADLAAWSALRTADLKPALADLGDAVAEVKVDGRKELLLSADVDALQATVPEPSACLLPHFDNYLLWRKTKQDLLDPHWHSEVWRKAAWVSPVALADGRIVAVWRVDRTASTATFTIQAFESLTARTRLRLAHAAARLAAMDGLAAEAVFEPLPAP